MKPVCIDCDGTLLRTDLLHEALVRVLRRRPWRIAAMFPWLFQGRNVLKMKLAQEASIDFANLPFRREVLEFAREKKAQGAKVYLVTAAAEQQALAVAEVLGIFDGVIASGEQVNLKGAAKEAELVRRFGRGGFDYVGDSTADMKVWASADAAVVAGRSDAFAGKVRRVNANTIVLKDEDGRSPRSWLRMLRLHQWAKNAILFVPLVTSHRVFDAAVMFQSLAAFLAFGLVASATYVANDLFDLDHDRAHRTKRGRPLASGRVGIPAAAAVAGILALAGFGLAALLPAGFLAVLVLYVVLTLSYSIRIKRIVLADTIMLAGLYTLRLLAGHEATGIPLSVWLLAFAIFLFFSLALAKRFVEVADLQRAGDGVEGIGGRGYRREDLPLVGSLGVASGVVSVLVVILYVSSEEVRMLYNQPLLLLLLAPLFLYWIGRIWLLAYRSELHEDPVLFAVTDKASYICGLAAAAVIFAASILP